MAPILVALSLAYGIPILVFAVGHLLARHARADLAVESAVGITVLVAARNESDHIEACVQAILDQDLHCSIVVVDDHSEDDTAARVATFGERVKLVLLEEGTGKKAAITEGVRHIETEWVLMTDADTIVPRGWARSMAACMTSEVGYVVGPVRLEDRRGLFHRMIQLEWAGFMGIAAGSIGLGRPTSACGSSVAFRLEAFHEVGGYDGVDHFASGDDEFLMQRIADKSSWGVAFCRDRAAIVTADAPETAFDFLRQRIRWASKAGHYERGWQVSMNIAIWFFFLLLSIGSFLAVFLPEWRPFVLAAWGIKLGAELLLLSQSAWFYQRLGLLLLLVPAQPFHVLYVLAASAAGVRGGVEWKSRKMKR